MKAPVTRRIVLGYMGAAAGAAAIGSGFSRRASAASNVTFLGWQGYEDVYRIGDFLKDNDATLDATYINTTEDIITKLRAGGVGSIDLATLNQMYVAIGQAAGLLEPIDLAKVPNSKDLLPNFQNDDFVIDGKTYALPFTFSSCALLYNPEMVSSAPTSWEDFLKPEYKGKVALFSDAMTNVLVWARVATGTDTPTRMTKKQLDETIALLIKIKKDHARAMPASLGDGSDMLARGEVAMIMGWEPMVVWCAEKGTKVEIAKPKEGTWGFLDTINIAKDAPNYDLDLAFVNQCVSAEAQAKFGNDNLLGVVNKDAVPQLKKEVQALYDFSDLDAYFANAHLYPMFPLESDGKYVTYDEMLEGYERFLKA
ncbi:extracellular solute-binding protein [Methyloligella sp. 2.7D]|uniref:ABC transporter substrate-binding protein n=1 Tax=unclassified Methyloligella TaxID=2625955 RepID=UPI00157E2063|nr:extracellular solute-binding protein [Methyloligella sp. GL2]QKP76008.1 extracellular solute-binding protein [Methyloligella sp. GL2]